MLTVTDLHFGFDGTLISVTMHSGSSLDQDIPYAGLSTGKHEIELMQWTGLIDVDGKEIYVGDIVEYAISKRRLIIYQLDSMDGLTICTHFITNKPSNNQLDRISSYENGLFKIIGNIYENPELLNDS